MKKSLLPFLFLALTSCGAASTSSSSSLPKEYIEGRYTLTSLSSFAEPYEYYRLAFKSDGTFSAECKKENKEQVSVNGDYYMLRDIQVGYTTGDWLYISAANIPLLSGGTIQYQVETIHYQSYGVAESGEGYLIAIFTLDSSRQG